MTQFILGVIATPVVTILMIFTIRRLLFLLTILLINKGDKRKIELAEENLPSILILVACRDEAGMIRDLAKSLRQLAYPWEKLQVVFIDDGSTDETAAVMREEAERTAGWSFFKLSNNLGKAGALNSALAHYLSGDLIYVLDADHRPDPQALTHLVQYFRDLRVAAVTGFTKIVNPLSSPSAYYSTIESYINQLVTMRAKDRLGLAPALLGSNCAYRRKTLNDCGGFRQGALSEDSDLTITFYRAGHKVRFAQDVVSCQQVPQTIRGYLRQHIRWGRGLNDVTKTHSLQLLRQPDFPFLLRLELLLFASGYLDRLAVIGAGILMSYSYLSGGPFRFLLTILLISLLTPFVQIIGLFIKEHINVAMWIRLPLLPFFFALDIFAAARAMLDSVLARSRAWSRTERMESL